jgi:plastocyanin
MSSRTLVIALIIIVILAAGAYFFVAHSAAAPATPAAAVIAQPQTVAVTPGMPAPLVTYSDKGFSPKTLSVKVGDTVRFVNNSSHGMWVASNTHPTHTQYDGTSLSQHCSASANTNGGFDECTPVDPGTVYSFTFTKAGSFMFHNHLQASDTGTVTVTQ